MATNEQKVKAVHPRASKKRYSHHGGGGHYLIWSGFPEGRDSVRLGCGKTASEAWASAAKAVECAAHEAGRLAAIMHGANEDTEPPYSEKSMSGSWKRGVAEGLQQIKDAEALALETKQVLRERR
jgi:hypothetical protein